jgi:ketosteroid isomerase-like protein
MRPAFGLMLPLLTVSVLCAQEAAKPTLRESTKAISAVIDDWHQAAAQADEARFFGHLAPDAVFLGMDETERWAKVDFQKIAHPWFENHATWNFKSKQRNTFVALGGDVAWFDELIDMAGNGTIRGSGVLVKQGDTWLISQYCLALPIPRQVFAEVLSVVNSQKSAASGKEPEKPPTEKEAK